LSRVLYLRTVECQWKMARRASLAIPRVRTRIRSDRMHPRLRTNARVIRRGRGSSPTARLVSTSARPLRSRAGYPRCAGAMVEWGGFVGGTVWARVAGRGVRQVPPCRGPCRTGLSSRVDLTRQGPDRIPCRGLSLCPSITYAIPTWSDRHFPTVAPVNTPIYVYSTTFYLTCAGNQRDDVG